ncbi:hypothetical protein BDR07DRAFT_1495506 [Suillus spraguei]|nr:hypothetical protein BDR07DRAFT_1495506 [Suillus spraguei]
MPATKMTAKKSNGGVAPRMPLTMPDLDCLTVPANVMDVSEDLSDHNNVSAELLFVILAVTRENQFCIICRDGSSKPNSLFQATILSQDIIFRCIVCHIDQQAVDNKRTPYFGFYKDGVPVLNTFLPILATLEVSRRAQISSSSVLFVHLTLVDNDTTGGPFELAYRLLEQYFPRGGSDYKEITFDIATKTKATDYLEQVCKLVQALQKQRPWSRLVIAITNHTDNDTGDLFAGYVRGKYISGAVSEVSAVLPSKPQLADHILVPRNTAQALAADDRRCKQSFLWLFACGALVKNPNSFKALQESLLLHHVTAGIAFTAPRFQPSFTSHLLLAFCELILIESVDLTFGFQQMLGRSNDLGRHTDLGKRPPSSMGAILANPMPRLRLVDAWSLRQKEVLTCLSALMISAGVFEVRETGQLGDIGSREDAR